MTHSSHQGPTPGDHVVFQRVSDGAVLLSTDDEVYYGLNEVGARVWQGLAGGEDVDSICEALADRYSEVDEATIRADVFELLDDLEREGLLSRPEDDESGDADGD